MVAARHLVNCSPEPPRSEGVSRSGFIRQQLPLVLEQYRRHPKPRGAGIVRRLKERGDERERSPSTGLGARAMEVDRRFADLGLGLIDGSIAALAESLDIRRLATRDVRHSGAVRLRDGRTFDLVVQPTAPDKS